MPAARHIPVMLEEVMKIFSPRPGQCLLDATLGHGGHAAAYLEATAPDGCVVGLDADAQAAAEARETLKSYGGRVTILKANFAHLKDSITGGGIVERGSTLTPKPPQEFDHILFDLGIGSHQLADPGRGFSFAGTKSLSMRYGASDSLPPSMLPSLNWLEEKLQRLPDAPDIIERLPDDELAGMIRTYGEERYAGRIARAIKERHPATSADLAAIVADAVPGKYAHGRLNPATRTFQALRLAVNRELEVLEAALPQAVELLKEDGRLVVISFHSLEDRIVKHFFRRRSCRKAAGSAYCLEILTKKPVGPDFKEISRNPRSHSAKMRAAAKRKSPPPT